MIWRKVSLALVCGIVLSGLALEMLSQTASSPLKILSAKRGESYASSPLPGASTLQPKHPRVDAVLVVELGGISSDEFDRIRKAKAPYLQAGAQRYGFSITNSGWTLDTDAQGNPTSQERKYEIKLAAVVPRQTLNFTLVVGDYPPLDFTVEEEIHGQLN